MLKFSFIRLSIFAMICSMTLFAQQDTYRAAVEGAISFISSQNCYVKFESTEGFAVGDTLYSIQKADTIGVIVLKFISTHSVAGEQVDSKKYVLTVGQKLTAFPIIAVSEKPATIAAKPKSALLSANEAATKSKVVDPDAFKITGRLSEQLASDFSKETEFEVQQFRTSLNFTIDNLFIPKLGFTNYLMYSYREDDWAQVKNSPFDYLRVYDLAFSYKFDSTSVLWVGRHLNYRTANAGTIDGLQFETSYKSYVGGLIIGSRPSFSDFGFDANYFQYGGYIGRIDHYPDYHDMENTIAFFNQTFKMNTDRRFMYLQHTNNIIASTNVFVSSEIELFKRVHEVSETTFSLSSIYASIRYAPIRELSFNLTYDARKNVIYYETFKSFIDNLLENELRQGVRMNVYVRPTTSITIGLNSGYRHQKSDNKPAKDYGTSFYYSNLPWLTTDLNLYGTYLTGSYLEGYSGSAEMNKIIAAKLYVSAGFRTNNYTYINSSFKYVQNSIFSYISYSLSRLLTIAVNYEGLFESSGNTNRVFIDVTTRF